MKRLALAILCITITLLSACTCEQAHKAFPPPEGYDSWDSYYAAYQQQTTDSLQQIGSSQPPVVPPSSTTETTSETTVETTTETTILQNVILNYSWYLESNYTCVPFYITNTSSINVDVIVKVEAFNSEQVILYDGTWTMKDIWPGETLYAPTCIPATGTANLDLILVDVYPSQTPTNSNRTDLVILNVLPVTVEQAEPAYIYIQNNSPNTLSVNVKIRLYDLDGYYRGEYLVLLGSIEPYESKQFQWDSWSFSPTYKYFIYLLD
jgi:hypothetical protein